DGDDTINGGDDNDVLSGGNGVDSLSGDAGNDTLYGGAGADLMGGGAGDDILIGGSGNDQLIGGYGNDSLYGTSGTNLIDGGLGDDNYFGGTGTDTFSFTSAVVGSTERVSFFEATDVVQLNGFGFANSAAAASSFSQSGGNVVFSSGGMTIVFYGANLADVTAAVVVDGSAELPSVDKQIVSETPSLPQDAIAEFLETVDMVDDRAAQIESEGFTFFTGADLLDGHGFDLL
ncbi:MAG TPA: calcium-binding protein, partial [Hellea balneolensis]|nr:calcium-binding protein [Hellea balneolensis]